MIDIIRIEADKPALCREVLEDLPDWFGIPEATAAYIEDVAGLPMLAAFAEGVFAGFLAVRRHTEFAIEIHVMGVKHRFHRRGIGRALIESLARSAWDDGIAFLTVKTLAASHPDPHYAATRHFYRALGFLPVEVFPSLWGTDNPCLFMIRPLSREEDWRSQVPRNPLKISPANLFISLKSIPILPPDGKSFIPSRACLRGADLDRRFRALKGRGGKWRDI